MKIKLNELDYGFQTRLSMNEEAVKEYAEAMQNGAVFPPITVVQIMAASEEVRPYLLVDGYHRVEAMKSLGIEETEAIVTEGDRALALSAALKVNANHGLRRTNADKRHALEIAWQNRDILFKESRGENGLPSVRELAQMCAVSVFMAHEFINYNKVLENNTPAGAAEEVQVSSSSSRKDDSILRLQLQTSTSSKTDRFGMSIPEELLPVFAAKLPREHLRMIRKIKAEMQEAYKANDKTYAALTQQSLVDMQNLASYLSLHAPYCVCRACRGEGCGRCRRRGYMNVMEYRQLPKEYRV